VCEQRRAPIHDQDFPEKARATFSGFRIAGTNKRVGKRDRLADSLEDPQPLAQPGTIREMRLQRLTLTSFMT
jgi:hypothetical protein